MLSFFEISIYFSESVEKIILSILFDDFAALRVHKKSSKSSNFLIFLFLSLFDQDLAGMIAMFLIYIFV